MYGLPRQSRRIEWDAEVKLRRSQDLAYKVKLRDISQHGCSIELVNPVKVGERLWIKLPDMEAIEGMVCWEKEFFAGVNFTSPLHNAVLGMLIKKHRLRPPT